MSSSINSQSKLGITYITVRGAAAMYYTVVGLEKYDREQRTDRKQRTDRQRNQLQRSC